MYTILIADEEMYSVGVFMTKEHAEKYKKDNELPSDALVIEIKEGYYERVSNYERQTGSYNKPTGGGEFR